MIQYWGIHLDDVDAVLAGQIMTTDARKPIRAADAVAVRAILKLSLAGAALYNDASVFGDRAERTRRTRGKEIMEEARQLMTELILEREA